MPPEGSERSGPRRFPACVGCRECAIYLRMCRKGLFAALGLAFHAQIVLAQGTVSFPSFTAEGRPAPAMLAMIQNGVEQTKFLAGPATIALAAGKWTLRVSHGPHFAPVSRDYDLHNGETASFGAVIFERAIDLRPANWFTGALNPSPGLDWTGHSYFAKDVGGIGLRSDVAAGEGAEGSQILAEIREQNGATFATRDTASLPFDLAAGLVDGLVIDGDESLRLWSMLLDHGYALAPVPGPGGRLIVPCPAGFSVTCIGAAVRQQRAVVTTGPTLITEPRPGQIDVSAWARADRPDRILRLELWAHNRVLATREATAGEGQKLTATFAWTPKSADDWVAVRLVAESGWAISSAVRKAGFAPPVPVLSHVKMVFPEIASQQQAGALASVWSGRPGSAGAKRLAEIEMERNEVEVDVPVTGVVRVELADGRRIDMRVFEASGVRGLIEEMATNPRRGEALLDWGVYAEVLRRLRRVSFESRL